MRPNMRVDPTLELAMDLMRRRSVTPDDAGCQQLLIDRLEPLGFEVHRLKFGNVDNFWAERGRGAPLVVLAGHTDVVPPGSADAWDSDPFAPEIRDGYLYGRGAADMKSSLAAFVTAVEVLIDQDPDLQGSLAFLITSDEEGIARDGTDKVVKWLQQEGKKIDYCLLGEPSSTQAIGDTIKIGRRGSLGGRVSIRGIQGHVAYPHLARNPIHMVAPALTELVATKWDDGYENFPNTTFQVSNIHAGTGADNMIPGELEVEFNLRYSPAVTHTRLRHRIEEILARHGLDYTVRWRLSGKPFITRDGVLLHTAQQAIRAELGQEAKLSTAGGTSDGRFIAPTGAQVVELGPVNATIHRANECVSIHDLSRLVATYARILAMLLTGKK